MFFKRLTDILHLNDRAPDHAAEDRLETSVAVLLVEAARMDDTFGDDERAVIEKMLAERFDMTADEVAALIRQAETTVADTTQYFPFTHYINQSMSSERKCELIGMLWQVAYADGVLDPHEDALIRQLAGLIYVTDRERAFARQRALKMLEADKGSKD